MIRKILKFNFLIILLFFSFFLSCIFAQQQDVPEPVFLNFSIQPLYVPTYHGRDPFRPINNVHRSPQVSITELDYHGIIYLSEKPVALFTWRGNSSIRYTLKYGKLYGEGEEIDGVVGEVMESKVVLIQGDKKIVFSRRN